jgi:hypothetical protein
VVKRDGGGRDLLGGFVGATGAVGALGGGEIHARKQS